MTSCTGNWVRRIVSGMTTANDARPAAAAAILKLIDAARAVVSTPGYGLANLMDEKGHALETAVAELDIFMKELEPEHVWRPSTWAEVATYGPGTRVRLGGVEAVVESIAALGWHVDPNSPARSPRPLDHTMVPTKLVGRADVYQFPGQNAVEVQDVAWPEVTLADWVAAAGHAQEVHALELLKAAFSAAPVAPTTDGR